MPMRAIFGTCLVAIALSAGPAISQDQSIARASNATDGCVRYMQQQAMVVRCAIEPQVASDHGMTAGEAYDRHGNPVDRHGNVIAVPAPGRGQAREVFTQR
jgi:hypothetical protein